MASAALENPITGAALRPRLMRDTGIERLRAESLDEPPSVVPPLSRPAAHDVSSVQPPPDLAAVVRDAVASGAFRFESIADYVRAYREGATDPEGVAERLLEAIARLDAGPTLLRAITAFKADEVTSQAKASAERHRRGSPLSPLDGVPVVVKEEFDVAGYPTTAGTRFLRTVASADATVVARLRALGALIYGKSNMNEIGIDVDGFNWHHGTARNPYDLGRYPGGSSSGSASAVAAGLGPLRRSPSPRDTTPRACPSASRRSGGRGKSICSCG